MSAARGSGPGAPWGLRDRRGLALAAGLVALIAVLAVGLLPSARRGREGETVVIEQAPFFVGLTVAGVIAPAGGAPVTAPLEGMVRQVGFAYGDRVSRGQILLALDPSDVAQRRDEAEAEFLRASLAQRDVQSWSSGPDVSRGRRAVVQATADLAEAERKARETRILFDKGLVARDELDSALQQESSQRLALASSRQDLAATLREGAGPNRRAASLDLAAARARLAELDAQLAGAVIRSPMDGVIVRPPSDKGDTPLQIHAGQQLAKGQLIGTIAGARDLAVSFRLSEPDANAVHPGQPVRVTGPGFPGEVLTGRIDSVAGEASPGGAAAGPLAVFAATARLDPPPPPKAAAVRIGMTADVEVVTWSSPSALVAPPAALQSDADGPFVRLSSGRRVRVKVGHVGPEGVEILSGLRAGDRVVVGPAKGAAGPT